MIARENPGVDDGWLCDHGRYGFEMFDAAQRVTEPRTKGGSKVSYEEAIARAAAGLAARDGKVAAIVGDASNEEGSWSRRSSARPSTPATSTRARRRPRRSRDLALSPRSRPASSTSTRPT